MKIVVVVPSLHGGGAEFVARTWMASLSAEGHEVTTVLVSADVSADHAPAGVAVISLSKIRGQSMKVRRLSKELARIRPDVVLSLQMHANLVAIAATRLISRTKRPKVVVSERNIVTIGLSRASISHRVKTRLARRLYGRADGFVAISHPVAAEMVAAFGVRPDRCYVVPNPATAKITSPSYSPPTDDVIRIVLPGRLVSQKRPHLGVAVARELADRGNAVELYSYGGGPLLDSTVEAARLAGVDFRAHGWVENWFDSCPAGAVILLASSKEGFGNVLVEAAAAGFASVASSSALGVADAIVPGLTGVLAVSDDPRDLADAVLQARTMRVYGVESWLDRFSVESSTRTLERVLSRVVGEDVS